MAIGLIMSPLTVGVCKRKSTRLTGVIGGLVLALGCLFSSFANQFHQLFFSHAIMTGKKNVDKYIIHIMFYKKKNIFPGLELSTTLKLRDPNKMKITE
jgi:hypothetical protein